MLTELEKMQIAEECIVDLWQLDNFDELKQLVFDVIDETVNRIKQKDEVQDDM